MPKNPDNKIIGKSKDSLKNTVIEDYFAVNNKRIIKEQSFDTVLEEFGVVSFFSCASDSNGSEYKEDVTFYLANEEMIYQFPFVYTDNICPFWYEEISYISFEDINQDGFTDAIMGVNYITGISTTGVIPFTLVRIYYSEGKQFVYGEELSEKINYDNAGTSIESVLEYILIRTFEL